MRKCVVISAVNLNEGGPLTVLQDCLVAAVTSLPVEWEIIALVHNQKLFNQLRVRFIEIPDAKSSWLRRLYHEWFSFKRLSKDLKPDLWFSLHDITPRVLARRQVVYCHNAAPFYRLPWREAWLEPKFWLFNRFYHHLYRVFIRRNQWVIVQQSWIRDAFKEMYGSTLPVVVAHPSVSLVKKNIADLLQNKRKVFFYPALPRAFKNFEVLAEATKLLVARGVDDFEVRFTLKGDENRYSKWLYKKYSNVPNLNFIGLQNREQMLLQYENASAVVFPSKLETWGLPISEAKQYKKPLLVADLSYAHETVDNYNNVNFFSHNDASDLANLMQTVIEQNWQPINAQQSQPQEPYVYGWNGLWSLLIKGL